MLKKFQTNKVNLRKKIKIPSNAEFTMGLRRVLEKIVSDIDDEAIDMDDHLSNQNTRLEFD